MDNFEKGFFEPVEQAYEHGAVRETVGNYKPDPVFKKMYVLVAGESYGYSYYITAASYNQKEIEDMKSDAHRICIGYQSAVNFLRKSNMLSTGTQSSLEKTARDELNNIGVNITEADLYLDELYFSVHEVLAKVG